MSVNAGLAALRSSQKRGGAAARSDGACGAPRTLLRPGERRVGKVAQKKLAGERCAKKLLAVWTSKNPLHPCWQFASKRDKRHKLNGKTQLCRIAV